MTHCASDSLAIDIRALYKCILHYITYITLHCTDPYEIIQNQLTTQVLDVGMLVGDDLNQCGISIFASSVLWKVQFTCEINFNKILSVFRLSPALPSAGKTYAGYREEDFLSPMWRNVRTSSGVDLS